MRVQLLTLQGFNPVSYIIKINHSSEGNKYCKA